jgi:hypothetical protein
MLKSLAGNVMTDLKRVRSPSSRASLVGLTDEAASEEAESDEDDVCVGDSCCSAS